MEIVGRDAELAAVRRFVDGATSGPRSLLLAGPAGIGKTTIWQAGVDDARRRGIRTALSRPTEAEAKLPFAGLTDLLTDLVEELPIELPAPQRGALDVALLRAGHDGEPPQPLAVSLAVLSVLRAASTRGPLLIAVDDLPWLDSSSAAALEFALRRVTDERVSLLATRRALRSDQVAPPLAQALAESNDVLFVDRLPEDAIEELVTARTPASLRRSTITRLAATAGGNPFFALELARAMERRGLSSADDLPMPDSLAELVRDRINALPEDAATVALHAAALSSPTQPAIVRALGEGVAIPGLAAAAQAGVLVPEGQSLRFEHPLLANEIYRRQPLPRRREVHARLAKVIDEPEERARHLAAAAARPHQRTATAVERAAASAWERGASHAAAELAEHARRLTPEGRVADRIRRSMDGARYHLFAGDLPRSRDLLESLVPDVGDGPLRGEILARLGEVRLLGDDWRAAESLFGQALEHAGSDRRLLLTVKLGLAGIGFITKRGWSAAARHIGDAMQIAEELDDPAVIASTIGHFAHWQFTLGHGLRRDLMERAASLEPATQHLRTMEHPDLDFGQILFELGEVDAYRERIVRLTDRAERVGDVLSLGFLWTDRAMIEITTGDWAAARRLVDEAERLSHQTSQRTTLADALSLKVRLLVRQGNVEDARRVGAEGIELATSIGFTPAEHEISWQLAFLELALGNAAAAVDRFAPLTGPEVRGFRTLPPWRSTEHVEALVSIGELEQARERIGLERREARRLKHPWYQAAVARAHGLVLGAVQDVDAAQAALEEARRGYQELGDPFEVARSLLITSEVLRRARRKRGAREAAHAALGIFEGLGSSLWVAQANQQLARTAGRRARSDGLTATQHQVAELVLAGQTNREIAAALYMSVHTVEAHLTAIYRAFGVRSRSQLASRLRDGAVPIPDSSEISGPDI